METHGIISFQKFGFQYRTQAEPTLFDIDLDIHRGEKLLIAGPSGCGKSTLAHCINGLIPASYPGKITGTLTVKGQDARKLGLFGLSKVVGTVLQDSDGQFVGLTVAEDIAFAMENDCIPTEEMKEHVQKVARLVGISQVLTHAPHEISGGQKQRVSLGGVMVNPVDVLLFDEPLANLDPATGKQAIAMIDDIHKRTGCAVVIIEHRLEDVLYRHVDRVVVMGEGRICFDGSPDELLCRDILERRGIREPLYVTALKYAHVPLEPGMGPASLDTLALSPEQQGRVRSWFGSRPEKPRKEEGAELLQVDNLSFAYEGKQRTLKNISLTIRKGEMVSIVGTNGAGKSTFSKVICGFETPQEGAITFGGENLLEYSIKQRSEHIGYVMQNPNQMISKPMIFDEVALGLRNRGVEEAEVKTRVEKALKICGLLPLRKWPISALSYGQKKRVTIASILVLEPEMILLDEPTAGQDFRHYTEIMDFLAELNAQGMTVVLITHDMHLMLEYTPRAIVFHDGRVIADGQAAGILNDLETIEKANLKETSLYHLAGLCGIEEREAFTQRFIDWDREVRGK